MVERAGVAHQLPQSLMHGRIAALGRGARAHPFRRRSVLGFEKSRPSEPQ
jgi:hypothetical protein